MKYELLFENELEFRKLERALKKYNMSAYKELMFYIYPDLRNGKLIGNKIGHNLYEVELPTPDLFSKVHGMISLVYRFENNSIYLVEIRPSEILMENHRDELITYKGVLISKENASKDMFKINLLNMLNQDDD